MGSNSLFPYKKIRPEQDLLISDIWETISNGKCLIAHAPTGLGKTAASLAPALEYALNNKKTIFFLTSRHTQHTIAIETLAQIQRMHKVKFGVIDMLGKKYMCARDEAYGLFSRQFHEYCSSLREKNGCNYFMNFMDNGKLSFASKKVIELSSKSPVHSEEMVKLGKKNEVCPYEIAAYGSRSATVIIADYNYIFNGKIRSSFLKRNSKTIEESIIIVDEAHNLGNRIREMLTVRLSTLMIERAMKEANRLGESEVEQFLHLLKKTFHKLAYGKSGEIMVERDQILNELANQGLDEQINRMLKISEIVRETQDHSYLTATAEFLTSWQSFDDGYARILKSQGYKDSVLITVSYHCLNPAVQAREVIDSAHSVILMSGTLTPTELYRDVLGFPEDTLCKQYKNPMPKENRLSLILGGVTTKFTSRSPQEFEKIALVCAKALNKIPGNSALFFPSYNIMDQIHSYLHEKIRKEIFKENQNMSKQEKKELLARFKQSPFINDHGGLLMAVIGGSFSEGIDLPGEALNAVIIVGLPFGALSLYTKEMVKYYDKLFHRGWEYGYMYPAFTKALQSAGRCIRSETDKGIVLFVDERYKWPRYYSCFPEDIAPKPSYNFENEIADFYSKI